MATIRLILAAAALVALSSLAAEAGNRSVYTSLILDKCKSLPVDPEDPVANGTWLCKGYGGIDVLVDQSDERTTVSYGKEPNDEPAASQTMPSFNTVGEKLEWRLDQRGRPIATILRFITEPNEAPKGSTLVVTRIGEPGTICWVGRVDAVANPDANEIARAVADNFAADFPCGDKEPIDYGVDGETVERD
jgi:hypothetical protein